MLADRLLGAGMQTLVQLVYPPRCLSCGGMVETDFGLCTECWGGTPFINGLACDGCGVPLPGASGAIEHCDDCIATVRPWARGRAAVVYGGTARRLVLGLKHGDRHDIARPAARWMARATREIVMPDMLVVPVPLHIHRHLVRRFNQAALLAKALAEELSLDWCPDALHRHAPTRSLKGQSSEQRHATLAGQISVPPKRSALFEDRPVLLVDDVLTTGATLGACAEACLAEGASVVCVSVLARVAKDA